MTPIYALLCLTSLYKNHLNGKLELHKPILTLSWPVSSTRKMVSEMFCQSRRILNFNICWDQHWFHAKTGFNIVEVKREKNRQFYKLEDRKFENKTAFPNKENTVVDRSKSCPQYFLQNTASFVYKINDPTNLFIFVHPR